jgi:hypothetical protein
MAIVAGCLTVFLCTAQQEIRAVGADSLGASCQHHCRSLVRSRGLLQTVSHALEGCCSPSTRPAPASPARLAVPSVFSCALSSWRRISSSTHR